MATLGESPTLFLRKATGLVKGWSKFDAFVYSFMSVNFVTLGLFFSLAVIAYVPSGQVLPSLLISGVFITFICLTGTLAWIAWAIPIDAGMAIVLWIGIVISAQAFQVTPREHAPAVVIGMLPGIGAWGALMAKNGLRAAGFGGPAGPFTDALIAEFQKGDTWIHGAFALEQGFLFTSMLLSAAAVGVIERKWLSAAAWCGVAALLSAAGLMHSYQWTFNDTALRLSPAWRLCFGLAS